MITSSADSLRVRLILVLALLSAVAPIATDLYLASFPQVESGLDTTSAGVQLTLTAFLAGLGLGQLMWGPISDRHGRFRPLLAGTGIATVAAAAAVCAPTIEALVAARFLQALGAAAGVVIARVVIADLLQGFAAARAMSLMMTIQAVAPIAAPVVGGALAGHVPWRGVLGVILGLTVLQLVGVLTTVRETLPADRRTTRLGYGRLVGLLGRPAFVAYALAQAFTFGTIMTYISNSSFVYQTVIGASSLVFGIGFGINALGVMLGGTISARRAKRRIHPAATVRIALPLLVASSTLVLLAAASSRPELLLGPMFVATTCVGVTIGNCTVLAIEHVPDAKGSGSAVIGGLMFGVGALVSPVGGLAGGDSAVPMGTLMLCSSSIALAWFAVARRFASRHPQSEAAFA